MHTRGRYSTPRRRRVVYATALGILTAVALPASALALPDRTLTLVTPGTTADDASFEHASADGTKLWFITAESFPGITDTDGAGDLYERSANGAMRLISTDGAGLGVRFEGASADGGRVWFSTTEKVFLDDTDNLRDVYERAADGTLTKISPGNAAESAEFAGAAADGSRVWFQTDESLVLADAGTLGDVYEYTPGAAVRLISAGSSASNGAFFGATADGAKVWFITSVAITTTSGEADTDNAQDVYERSADGSLRLISTGVGNGGANNASFGGATADGSRVWFTTSQALLPEDTDATPLTDVYERRADGTLRLVTPDATIGPAFFRGASADGNLVWTHIDENVPAFADSDNARDVYEHNVGVPSTRLISTGGATLDAILDGASADGGRVWFHTSEALLPADDLNGFDDVYERTAANDLRLISDGGAAAADSAFFSGGRADGSAVWFSVFHAIPAAGDADNELDVFERKTDGSLQLLSTSGADLPSEFVGATPDGSRVWFHTPESIPGAGDTDGVQDIYERAFGPPASLIAPQLAGAGQVGATLTCTPGTWDTEGVLTESLAWQRDGAAISGATGSSYVVTADDQGRTLTCAVTAANPAASTTLVTTGVSVPAPPAAAAAGGPLPVQPQICKPVAAAIAAKPGDPSKITLSVEQLLINQRIDQAAIRRANAIQAWLDAGLEAQDFCQATLGAVELSPGSVTDLGGAIAAFTTPNPRPVTPAPATPGDPSGVTLSTQQILINQRISQAAIRRLNGLKARLDGGLSGGDVKDRVLSAAQLAVGLRVVTASAPSPPPARTVTVIAKATPGDPSKVTLTTGQLLINQRISQTAVRRANDLIARLGRGISGTDIKDGTIAAADLAPGVAGAP